VQSQQPQVGSFSGPNSGIERQHGQQTGHEQTRQYVEAADTKLLADALSRRLGLSSQQLAQVVPQLGVALGSQRGSEQQGGQQSIGQQGSPGGQQPASQVQPQQPQSR
jgi:hypothetical protein